MRIDILTLFPEMFVPLTESIIGRAVKSGKVEIVITDIRDYTENKHRKCDDYPFGGGAGMLMMAQPIVAAFSATDPEHKAYRVYMSPKGRTFRQSDAVRLSKYDHIVLLCGHYEGVDQRVLDLCFDDEISIGDYVLTGGELPAMVITDAIARYVDGVLAGDSLNQESFTDNLLEYPQYSRPYEWHGKKVPDILMSGHHENVEKWRFEQSLIRTEERRPDLYKKFVETHEKDKKGRFIR